jgi:phosphoribosylformylglycinamidine synthase
VPGSWRGLVVANGMNPRYGDVDPYAMAASAIDECMRQIAAVGAPLDRVAILDNFCWGNTDKPDRLGSLVRAALACRDVALAYGTPFISGKDSLNNEYAVGGNSIAIPPSLLISGIAVMPDVRKAVSMDAKTPGNPVYIVGLTKDELGGSHYYALHDAIGRRAPQVDTEQGPRTLRALHGVMDAGCVAACHDCSEGGLAVAAAEMAFAGGLGMEISLAGVPAEGDLRDDTLLFSESNSRLLVEVKAGQERRFEDGLSGAACARIGRVTHGPDLVITDAAGRVRVRAPWRTLKEAWQAPLAW